MVPSCPLFIPPFGLWGVCLLALSKRREAGGRRLEMMAEPFPDVDSVRAASLPFKSDPERTEMQLVWMKRFVRNTTIQ